MDLRLGSDLPNLSKTKRINLERNIGSIQVLVSGNSHPMCGINPDKFQRSGFNLGFESTDLFEQQQLLYRYVDAMPNLKLVLQNISDFSLRYNHIYRPNNWITCDFVREFHIFPTNLLLLSDYDFCSTLTKMSINPFGNIIEWQKYITSKNYKDTIAINNGWVSCNHPFVYTPQPQTTTDVNSQTAKLDTDSTSENLMRIRDINSLLKNKGIKFVLITTPYHRYGRENIMKNPVQYDEMQKEINLLSQKYGIPYYNFIADTRFTDEDYQDPSHLNPHGADKFSEIIRNEIIRPILGLESKNVKELTLGDIR